MAILISTASKEIHQDEAPDVDLKLIDDVLPTLKDSYNRIVLISRAAHLNNVEIDSETLVIICDWLLWQQVHDELPHSIFYEAGLKLQDVDDDLGANLFLRANEWVYAIGKEKMLFMGVSLGKQFSSEMTRAIINYYRIVRTLTPIIETFGAKEVVYFDYRNEINFFDQKFRKNLIQRTVEHCGSTFIDKSVHDEDHYHAVGPRLEPVQSNTFRTTLRDFYGVTIEHLSKVCISVRSRKNRVAVLVNSNLLKPLIAAFDGQDVTPVVNLLSLPKQFSVIFGCLRKGVLLTYPRQAVLSKQEKEAISSITAEVLAAETPEGSPPETQFAIDYFKQQILAKDRLVEAGVAVKSAFEYISKHRPKRIVVDGVKNMVPRSHIEAASFHGAEVDYIWHAPLTPQRLKFDLIGGDPHTTPLVTRILSWGKINEKWLEDIQAKQPVATVGSPLAGKYTAQSSIEPKLRGRALVLQYAPIGSDLKGLNENMYIHFVRVARALKSYGYSEICLKLHPGPGRWPKSYFAKIDSHFGINSKILKTEPLEQCLQDADIVIGPVQSGAFFEALAAGKRYVAFLLPPHTMSEVIYGEFPVLTSIDQLKAGIAMDTNTQAKHLLNGLYGTDDVKNPPKAFWQSQVSNHLDS